MTSARARVCVCVFGAHNKRATRTVFKGRVAELDDSDSNEWISFEEQLEEYLKAKGIMDDGK